VSEARYEPALLTTRTFVDLDVEVLQLACEPQSTTQRHEPCDVDRQTSVTAAYPVALTGPGRSSNTTTTRTPFTSLGMSETSAAVGMSMGK
jgi:hypothetical protein